MTRIFQTKVGESLLREPHDLKGLEEGHSNSAPIEGQTSVEQGTLVTDFDEYTFRAPRPGFFLGDSWRSPKGELNLITTDFLFNADGIPNCPAEPPFLGLFDKLPVDLITQILLKLDLCSFIALRSVNQRSRELVDSLQQFRDVATFPKLLSAVLRLECRFFDLQTLFNCINDPKCWYCGHFGDMLYLVTAERWCYKCWRELPATEVLVASSLTPDYFEFSPGVFSLDFSGIPHVKLVPGYYGIKASATLSESKVALDGRAFRKMPNNPLKDIDEAYNDLFTIKPDPSRYLAVIRGPYFDKSSQAFEEGFFCSACAGQVWEMSESVQSWGCPFRRYTRDGMKNHIKLYGRIFRLQDHNGEARYGHELPFPRHLSRKEDAYELTSRDSVFHGCRLKHFQVPQLQPFLRGWDRVSSGR